MGVSQVAGSGGGPNSRFFVLTAKLRSALYRRTYGETNDKKCAK